MLRVNRLHCRAAGKKKPIARYTQEQAQPSSATALVFSQIILLGCYSQAEINLLILGVKHVSVGLFIFLKL